VLLTSRRTETASPWLGQLPVRVQLPPMPMRERLHLTHALITHLAPHAPTGARAEVDWRPLLRFTGGNPLTITVTVRQLLHTIPTPTTEQVRGFVEAVQTGQTPLEDPTDAEQGRDRSLTASLDYGFRHAFTDPERQ
jgi:hypothetical protein